VANYGKLSAYSCGGSCGIRVRSRHRIPFHSSISRRPSFPAH